MIRPCCHVLLFLSVLTPWWASAKSPQPEKCCRQVNYLKPERTVVPRDRFRAGLETWDTREVRQTQIFRKDPWRAKLWGVRPGDRLTFELQRRSNPLIEKNGKCDPVAEALGSGKLMKLRRAVKDALNFRLLHQVKVRQVPKPGVDALGIYRSAPALEVSGSQHIPVHTPVRIKLNPRSGRCSLKQPRRPSAQRVVRAEGRDTRYQTPEYIRFEGGVTTIRRTHSGVPKEHYRPWVVDENLYVTPAHTGTDGKGVAKLVGLAAFPINAKVTITNLEMERRHDLGHTVKARLKQRTGSLQALLPAPAAGASYRMVVSFPSDHLGAGSRSVELTHQFSLPVPTSGEARAGKLVYRRVGLDEGKHHISHGMYLEGWPTNPPSGGPW